MGFEKFIVRVKRNEPLPTVAARGVPLVYLDREENQFCAPCATESVKEGDETSAQRFELYFGEAAKCSGCGAEIRGSEVGMN
jgi:hypothetical protein